MRAEHWQTSLGPKGRHGGEVSRRNFGMEAIGPEGRRGGAAFGRNFGNVSKGSGGRRTVAAKYSGVIWQSRPGPRRKRRSGEGCMRNFRTLAWGQEWETKFASGIWAK